MTLLRKELIETRQALAHKEVDSARLENPNSRLNDELALVASERKWLLSEGVPLVKEVVRGSREMCDAVTEISCFSNLLGYQQGLAEWWRLRGEGKPISNALHYDPESQAKLDAASDAFDGVEFADMARVFSLEDSRWGSCQLP
jgi:hypothetical protein